MAHYYHGEDTVAPSTPTNTPYQLVPTTSESLYSEAYTDSDYADQQLPCYGTSPDQGFISHPLRPPLRLPMPTFSQQPYTDPRGVLFKQPLLKRPFLKWGFLERSSINRPSFNQNFFKAPISKVSLLRATAFKELFSTGPFSRTWLRGVIACAFAAAVVLFLNTSWTIYAVRKYDIELGLGTIHKGSCRKTKRMAFWAHICINTLSTVLLGGSNYCMQCLAAPTRSEVNSAHEKGLWMDIGASSMRNFRSIKWCRVVLWGFLGISSAPLHLLYNSAVFESLATNQYQALIAPENSLELPSLIEETQRNDSRSSGSLGFQYLDVTACANAYAVLFLTNRRDVIVVVGADQNSTSIQNFTAGLIDLSQGIHQNIQNWMCPEDMCDNVNPVDFNNWKIRGQLVQYCISEEWQGNCSLQFSTDIMIVVIICNAVKCICMILVVVCSKEPALINLGDAISSFLQTPDKQTAGMCLVGKSEIRKDNRKGVHEGFFQGPPYQKWHPHKVYWFRAASVARWKIFIVASVLLMVTALYLLSKGFQFLNDPSVSVPLDLRSLWNLGFGTVDSRTQIDIGDMYYQPGFQGIWSSITTANSIQLALSILYLLYNSLLTSMLHANEWDQLSYDRKTLRVTRPAGKQRSSYFISLPYKYSLPLMATWGMMHWLVSQSIFLLRVIEYDDKDEPTLYSMSGMGYSPISIICAVSLGYIILLTVIINGFRRYRGEIPLVGSCSAAISAACHPVPHMKPADTLSELQWGAIAVGGGVECCTINGSVLTPIRGKVYVSAAEAEESQSASRI